MINERETAVASPPIRVLIVDDQTIVRKGIRALLAEVGTIAVVGEASSGVEAIAQVQALQPDVTVMDLVMPIMDGVEAIRQITARQPGARILVLTSFTGDSKVFPAIKAGALGYLLKDSEPADLIRAIIQVSRGEPSLHPSIAIQVLNELRHPAQKTPVPNVLTAREVDVLSLVAKGLSNREIAVQLTTTEATIKTHVSSVLSKLHLANRVQATLYALHEGADSLQNSPEGDG
ncbi:MAG: response regulator transcription factor [Chloroflexi bacterium]|nr:response regulator transcription factor [Chloroflexota bacterium]